MSENFKDRLTKALYGIKTKDALIQNVCIRCRQSPHRNIFSDAGIREYQISGLCEKCFDEITLIYEDDDYDEPAF